MNNFIPKYFTLFLFITLWAISNAQIATIPDFPIQYYNAPNSDDRFADKVWSGGDVNGDGFEDVITLNLGDGSDSYVSLFYGVSGGFSDVAIWSFIPVSHLGFAVDLTGDYNNDGFDDILVGVYNNSANCFYGSATGPSALPSWSILTVTIQYESHFGTHLANAGDVNNDGYDDVLIGAHMYDNGQIDEGKVFLYKGGPSGISATSSWSQESNVNYYLLGSQVQGLGDMNDDGYDDVAISAENFSSGNGRVYLYKGNAGGLATTATWTATGSSLQYIGQQINAGDYNGDGHIDIAFSGNQVIKVHHGNGVTFTNPAALVYTDINLFPILSTGNANGDAYDDLLFSSYDDGWIGCTGAYENSGRSIALLLGTSNGLFKKPVWSADENIENCPYYTGVAFTQDFTGDGKDEFYIGDSQYEEENYDREEGALFLYSGGDFEFPLLPSWEYSPEESSGDVNYGQTVDVRGNINGDGYSDLSIGRRYTKSGEFFFGAADLFSTTYSDYISSIGFSTEMDCSGDFNNDGYSDCIYGAPFNDFSVLYDDDGICYMYPGSATGLSAAATWTYGGTASFDKFGTAVANIGDINGDGYDDAAFGMPFKDQGSIDEGAIQIFLGSALGLSTIPFQMLTGDQDYAYFGSVIANAGDVNGDGFNDMILGIPDYDVSCTDDGVIYLFYGSTYGFTDYPNWVYYGPDCFDSYGFSVAGNIDINADGFDDIIAGSPYTTMAASTDGKADVFLGSIGGLGDYPDITFQGESADDNFGIVVSGAGDFNADGYDDFMIGSPNYNYGADPQGLVKIYYGKKDANGIDAYAWRLYRATHNTSFGSYISGGGDLNGDGADDIAIGEENFNNDSGYNTYQGNVHLYLGIPVTCSTVTAFTTGTITEFTASISWSADADAQDFALRWRKSGTTIWNYSYPEASTYNFTGLLSCTNYEYAIQVNCSNGSSIWSSTQNFTTNCAPSCTTAPTGLFADNITSVSVKLHWSAAPGATKYKIYYKATTSPTWIIVNSTSTVKTISGLAPNTNYQYKVKAVCTGTSSPFSSVSYFTTLLKSHDPLSNDIEISIYPNPTHGLVTIYSNELVGKQITVRLSSSSGETIFLDELIWSNDQQFDFSNIAHGCYFLEIISDEFEKNFVLINQ